MKQRNHAFDFLCGICILRMVSLHVMQMCGEGGQDWWNVIMSWSFFFFKAGYFNKSLAGDSKAYCLDNAKRLLIPYLAAGLIGDVIYFAFFPQLLSMYKNPIEPITWSMVWERSHFFGNPPCWFLFSFFSAYILAHFIEKVRYLHWIVLLFPWVSYWMYTLNNPMWMSFNNVFIGIFFFSLGRVWRKAMERMGKQTTIYVSVALIVYFVIANFLWHGEYAMARNAFDGNPVMAVINTTAILCGLAGLLIAVDMPRIPLINFIGEHSMVYFISHYPILYFYKFTHLCFGRSIWGRADDVIILLPALFMICSWLVPYIERVPWLSGRWPKKEVVKTPVAG